jgi:hypothetical protein
MHRIVIVALACITVDGARMFVVPSTRPAAEERLQGRWEIVSMQRSGMPDQSQVGALLTFDGAQVVSQPKGLQINDGTG